MTSIVIPVYNLANYIGGALDSVRAQTDPEWEAVVVDDCSTDDSRAVVQEYIARHRDSRIRLVWPDKNGGVGAARNLGVSHARGEWLGFLDGDDFYEPDFISALTGTARANRADIAYCRTRRLFPDGVTSDFGPSRAQLRAFPESLYARNYILPTMMICSREAWTSVGPYDTTPTLQHVEDWDWILRSILAGLRFAHVPKRLSTWRQHPASATAQRLKQCDRNEALLEKYLHLTPSSRYVRKGRVLCVRERAYWTAGTNPAEAARLYRKAIRLNPLCLSAYARLVIAWLYQCGRQGMIPRFLRFRTPS